MRKPAGGLCGKAQFLPRTSPSSSHKDDPNGCEPAFATPLDVVARGTGCGSFPHLAGFNLPGHRGRGFATGNSFRGRHRGIRRRRVRWPAISRVPSASRSCFRSVPTRHCSRGHHNRRSRGGPQLQRRWGGPRLPDASRNPRLQPDRRNPGVRYSSIRPTNWSHHARQSHAQLRGGQRCVSCFPHPQTAGARGHGSVRFPAPRFASALAVAAFGGGVARGGQLHGVAATSGGVGTIRSGCSSKSPVINCTLTLLAERRIMLPCPLTTSSTTPVASLLSRPWGPNLLLLYTENEGAWRESLATLLVKVASRGPSTS